MRSDIELEREILAKLRLEPSINHEDLAIAVKHGVVTLTGVVGSFVEWHAAERAVERTLGVKMLVNELIVGRAAGANRTDAEIAHAVANAFKWDVQVPAESIRVTVTDGEVTLEGSAPWNFPRMAAERMVRNLAGVRGVSNLIRVQQVPATADVKQRIAAALRRQAELDAERITVEAKGHAITLRGTVRTLAERREAEDAAWRAPGVTRVENELVIDPAAPAMV
jgi:osmotically-inducible protein OsmY